MSRTATERVPARQRLSGLSAHSIFSRATGSPGSRNILSNAGSMVGTTLVTAGLGAAFWWLAAREFRPEALGVASAAISAMTLLGTLATLGFNTLLMGELPRRRAEAGRLVAGGLLLTGAAGAGLGMGFALLAPLVAPDMRPFGADLAVATLFAFGVALTAVTLVLDQALIGLLRGNLQLSRNTVFALVKLVALAFPVLLLNEHVAVAIYACWAFGNLASLALVSIRLRLRRVHAQRYRPQWSLLRGLPLNALGHHGFNLALKAPVLLLPLLVVSLLSARANASFYIAFMIAGFVYAIPIALTTVLYAVAAGEPQAVAGRFRFSLRMSAMTAVAANVVLLSAASVILSVFGESYSQDASSTLRILALATFPLIVKNHFVAACRVFGRVGRMVPLVWLGTALELSLAALGAQMNGIEGLSIGWLVALVVEAACMSRTVGRALRPPLRARDTAVETVRQS